MSPQKEGTYQNIRAGCLVRISKALKLAAERRYEKDGVEEHPVDLVMKPDCGTDRLQVPYRVDLLRYTDHKGIQQASMTFYVRHVSRNTRRPRI